MYNYIEFFIHLKAFNNAYKKYNKYYKNPSPPIKRILNLIENSEKK